MKLSRSGCFFAVLSMLCCDCLAADSDLKIPLKIVLFPYQEAVVSSRVATRVLEYKFKEGESFSKGDTIVLLDDRPFKQAYLKNKALFRFADENYKHVQKMFQKNAIGAMDLEQGKVEKETAEANMNLSEIDLLSCEIKAPFNGRLTRKIIRENESVSAGQPIMEIIDDNKLLADMHIPSSMRKEMSVGKEFEFLIDETGSTCKGKVYEISGRIDYGSRTFGVRALIDNADRKLTAGMSGSLLEKER